MTQHTNRVKSFIQNGVALAAGLGLTAFYWLPAILEKKFVRIDRLVNSENVNYRDHFAAVSDIFDPKWTFGGVGWLLLLAIAGIIVLLFLRNTREKFPRMAWLMPTMAVIFIFMTTQPSQFIWDRLPLLPFVGYPFRLFGPAGLFSAACLFMIIESLVESFPAADRSIRSVIFLLVIAVTVSSPLMQHVVHPHEFNEPDLMSERTIRNSTSSTVVADEYAPKWVIKKPYEDLDITFDPTQPFPQGDVSAELNKSHKKEMVVWADGPGKLILNTVYFPGWTVMLDEQSVPLRYDNPYGLLELDIPGGAHKVTMEFKATPVRIMANGVSLFTLLGFFLLPIRVRKKLVLRDNA